MKRIGETRSSSGSKRKMNFGRPRRNRRDSSSRRRSGSMKLSPSSRTGTSKLETRKSKTLLMIKLGLWIKKFLSKGSRKLLPGLPLTIRTGTKRDSSRLTIRKEKGDSNLKKKLVKHLKQGKKKKRNLRT